MNQRLGSVFVKSKNILMDTEKQNLNLWLSFKNVGTVIVVDFMTTGTVGDNRGDLCFQKQVLQSLWGSLYVLQLYRFKAMIFINTFHYTRDRLFEMKLKALCWKRIFRIWTETNSTSKQCLQTRPVFFQNSYFLESLLESWGVGGEFST